MIVIALSEAKKLQLRDKIPRDFKKCYNIRYRQLQYCRVFEGKHTFSQNTLVQREYLARVIYKVGTNQCFAHYQKKEDLIKCLINKTNTHFYFLPTTDSKVCAIQNQMYHRKSSRDRPRFILKLLVNRRKPLKDGYEVKPTIEYLQRDARQKLNHFSNFFKVSLLIVTKLLSSQTKSAIHTVSLVFQKTNRIQQRILDFFDFHAFFLSMVIPT
ncbi:Hypothetical_protein [Hexamita inflata]|uniref:Hypothetical_protein n=1 Tax=Hexamita inflata TaxID=28002 RepID=A0AA86U056_9EUKA|nr:Hypothetical protein HINF_LOCUS22756 [Hexamita inflata]CAI9942521.1 Hypothetical protein HINF_LOCUS30166 [Hexamita inflata]